MKMLKNRAPAKETIENELKQYPSLQVKLNTDDVIVEGSLTIYGSVFDIKIVLDSKYPNSFPRT